MKMYKTTSHAKYDLKVHLIWITKYRKPVLYGQVAVELRRIVRQICEEYEVEIVKGNVAVDHVHLFVSFPPSVSISNLMKSVKGRSSHKLLSKFSDLKKKYWRQRLWARGYCAVTSGNITDEMIMQYIENQDKEQFMRDDDFRISGEL